MNPFSLTYDQLRILHSGLPRARAIRELRERNLNSQLTGDALYTLILNITRSKSKAELSRAKFWQKELRAGRVPAGFDDPIGGTK